MSCRMISHGDEKDTSKTSKLATTRELGFHVADCPMADGTTKKVRLSHIYVSLKGVLSIILLGIAFDMYTVI